MKWDIFLLLRFSSHPMAKYFPFLWYLTPLSSPLQKKYIFPFQIFSSFSSFFRDTDKVLPISPVILSHINNHLADLFSPIWSSYWVNWFILISIMRHVLKQKSKPISLIILKHNSTSCPHQGAEMLAWARKISCKIIIGLLSEICTQREMLLHL